MLGVVTAHLHHLGVVTAYHHHLGVVEKVAAAARLNCQVVAEMVAGAPQLAMATATAVAMVVVDQPREPRCHSQCPATRRSHRCGSQAAAVVMAQSWARHHPVAAAAVGTPLHRDEANARAVMAPSTGVGASSRFHGVAAMPAVQGLAVPWSDRDDSRHRDHQTTHQAL